MYKIAEKLAFAEEKHRSMYRKKNRKTFSLFFFETYRSLNINFESGDFFIVFLPQRVLSLLKMFFLFLFRSYLAQRVFW